ncbi:MAG: ATP-binding cassette domain-containing protein, partial [Acetobacteraceae bacterium]|nr:ATP-binding cassette domain-containing protein [Acetobacteraceae bacterium]
EVRNIARNAVNVLRGRQVVPGHQVEEFWALKDVSFEVERGEVLGIIGRNGAGKSTLLKVLSRITEPTRGRVVLRGRVASLLEVGTGFHPELTGRENIHLNGAILGMARAEIRRKFDEIIAFAGVEKFIDTPVKRYSSGMYVRLAFAVAAHLQPDILVVDEVLAVGDAEFQQKCLGKMDEVSRSEGRTVLFVSHNLSIIEKLCKRCIWLDGGSVREIGSAAAVIKGYLSFGHFNRDRVIQLAGFPRSHYGGEDLRLISIEWLCDLPLRHTEAAALRILFKSLVPLAYANVWLAFCDLSGRNIAFYEIDSRSSGRQSLPSGVHAVDIEVKELPLTPNTYLIDACCSHPKSGGFDFVAGAAQVEVAPGSATPQHLYSGWQGAYLNSKARWTTIYSGRGQIEVTQPAHKSTAVRSKVDSFAS